MNSAVLCFTINCVAAYLGGGPSWRADRYTYIQTPVGEVVCFTDGRQPCLMPAPKGATSRD